MTHPVTEQANEAPLPVFDYRVNPNIDPAVHFSGFRIFNSNIAEFIDEMKANDDFGVYCPWRILDRNLSNDEWADTVYGARKYLNTFSTTFWLEKVEGTPSAVQAWIRFMNENPNITLIP